MKRISFFSLIISLILLISGCGQATNVTEEKDILVIATNPSFNGFPEILKYIQPKMKKEHSCNEEI